MWTWLTDFSTYGQWNPFIRSIEGKPIIGERLTEHFSGILQVPLFRLIGKSTEQGFQLMNQALKERSESRN